MIGGHSKRHSVGVLLVLVGTISTFYIHVSSLGVLIVSSDTIIFNNVYLLSVYECSFALYTIFTLPLSLPHGI